MDTLQRRIILTEAKLADLKSIRNERILEAVKKGWSLEALAQEYGLSRQRMHQIVLKNRK